MSKRKDIKQFLMENPAENYFPEALKSGLYSAEEMRQHYSYYRSIANKRLQNFKGTEYEHHQSYRRNVDKFVPLTQIKNERELMMRLYEVQKFLRAKSGSVSGIRDIERRTLETARNRGLTFLNKGNIRAFGEFMEEARARGYARLYGSERVAELFGTATRKGINPLEIMNDFQYWVDRQEELESIPRIQNAKMRTAEHYKSALENRDRKR